MATSLKELIVTYEANARPVIDALNQIDSKIKQTSQALKASGDQFINAGKSLSLFLSAPLGLLSVNALKASADFEALKMQMQVLTGSAEEGDRVFRDLVKFAAETPFELGQLAKATNTLMGFGESATQAQDHLKLIGDIAAVSGGDFNGITVAFGQASASGKLMGQDLLQLVNNGVPVIKMLADEMKVPKDRIKDLVSEGKVTFPVLVRAFERATGAGGMFENGMNKLSKTMKGVWSTLKDNINIALAKFGDEMQLAFGLTDKIQAFGNWIGKLAANFQRLAPETRRNILLFVGFAVAIGPILIAIGTLIKLIAFASAGFAVLSGAVAFVLNPITLLIAAMVVLYTQWEDFRIVVNFLAEALFNVFTSNPIKEFINDLSIVFDWLTKIASLGFGRIFKDAKLIIDTVVEKVDKTIAGPDNFNSNAKQSVSNVAGQSQMNNNQTSMVNNLTVNIPTGVSASDSTSIKSAIKSALAEENRHAYLEASTQ